MVVARCAVFSGPAKVSLTPGPGPNWYETLAQRDAERRQENARAAAYYANQAKAGEEREAAEAKTARARNGASP